MIVAISTFSFFFLRSCHLISAPLSLSLSLSHTHTHMHKVKFPQKIPHFVSQDFFSDFHLIVCWSVFPFVISTSSVPPSRRPY